MKDLYKVLKVPATASQNEIKDAYRKLALALHPDRHAGCEIKTSEFKTATDAYQTLSGMFVLLIIFCSLFDVSHSN